MIVGTQAGSLCHFGRAGLARQREDALEKLRLLLLHVENLAQIFQLALLLLLAALRRFLRVDPVEKIVRRDLLVAGEQARVIAEQRDERGDLRLGGLGEGDLVVALVGRKEVVGEDGFELRADAVHAPDALHHAARVPRDVVVDDRGRAMKVHAFREDIGRYQDAVVVERLFLVRIEVRDDGAAKLGAGCGAEEQRLRLDILFDLVGQIAGGVGELGEDDELSLGQRGGELALELDPLRVALDRFPRGLNLAQRREVGGDVLAKVRREFRRVELLGFLLGDEVGDGVVVAFLQKFEHLVAVLAARVNEGVVERLQDEFVGLDEPRERFLKCVEAAFQPLHEQDFHEGGEVPLALHGALFHRPGVVFGIERLIARVVEIGARDALQRVGEDGALRAVELVEQR